MNTPRLLSRLLASALVLAAVAAPAQPARAGTLEPSQTPWGDLSLGLEAQQVPGRPLVTGLAMTSSFGMVDVNTALRFTPTNFTSFFMADADAAYVGQTGSFFPFGLNLMPLMGLGAGMYLADVPGASGSNTEANVYFYSPIGLKFALPLGPAALGARVFYIHKLGELMSNSANIDPSRMHYEVSAKIGALGGSVFYETGTFLSGPGARVSLVF